MSLQSVYINRRAEFFDAEYGAERLSQYASVSRLYNRTIGPIRGVSLYPPEATDLSMFGTSCGHTPAGRIARDVTCKSSALDVLGVPIGGKGPSMRQAFLGALGEGSERILAILHSIGISRSLELTTYAALVRQGRRALGPADIPLFASEQYAGGIGFTRFEEDSPMYWVEGRGLFDRQPAMVPAQLVLFYYTHHAREAKIGYATSGGLVFHPDQRQAILYGIYENLERDAINLRWHCRMWPPETTIDLAWFLREQASLACPRVETPSMLPIRVLYNTLDVPIPIFTAMTLDRTRSHHMLLAGGGAWARKERALSQAIFEIGQMQIGYKLFPHAWDNIRPDSHVSELTDFYHAPIFYGFAQNLHRLNNYAFAGGSIAWSDVATIETDDVDAEFEVVTALLKQRGIQPVIFDFSSACGPGLSVTKVYMPQFTAAHIPSHPFFGHPRYYEMPRQLGLTDQRLTYADLLREPLPFP